MPPIIQRTSGAAPLSGILRMHADGPNGTLRIQAGARQLQNLAAQTWLFKTPQCFPRGGGRTVRDFCCVGMLVFLLGSTELLQTCSSNRRTVDLG